MIDAYHALVMSKIPKDRMIGTGALGDEYNAGFNAAIAEITSNLNQ